MNAEPEPQPAEHDPVLERLLLEVLDAPDGTTTVVLESACREAPQLADVLQRRVRELQRFGLLAGDREPAKRPAAIGPYRILSVLGHGGMGVVYLAEHTEIGRRVALKCIRPEFLGSERARERFRRETQAIARLQHPGLATLYETGEWQGQPFLAMQFVAGETLEHQLRRARAEGHVAWSSSLAGRPSTDGQGERGGAVHDAVALVERLARAVQQVHGAGVVHRDLKPGNVMVTPQGEPVLLDFGLARDLLDEAPTLTRSADLVGTPAYMAPEQIEPRGRPVDACTDVHALGALLYECLTLRPPFLGQGREETYRRILATEPVELLKLQPAAGRDLASVVHRALAKDPKARFAGAAEFADELLRVMRGEPTRTRPAGPARRTWSWLRQRPAWATASAALVLALVVGVVATVLVERQARMRILFTEAKAETPRDAALGAASAAEALDLGGGEPARSALYVALGALRLERTGTFQNTVTAMAATADGQLLVAVLWGGRIELVRGDQRQIVQGLQGRPRLVQIDEATQRILVVGEWETATLLDFAGNPTWLDDLSPEERTALEGPSRQPRSHARGTIAGGIQGDVVFTVGRDGCVHLFGVDGTRVPGRCFTAQVDGHDWIAAARDPATGMVVFGARNGRVVAFAATGALAWTGFVADAPVRFVAFSPDGERVLAATGMKQHWLDVEGVQPVRAHVVRIFDGQGAQVDELLGHRQEITHASWFADSRRVVTASFDRDVRIWDLGDRRSGRGRQVAVLSHDRGIEEVALHPDQQRLLSVSVMSGATLWSAAGTRLADVTGTAVGAFAGGFGPTGDHVLVSTLDKRLLRYDVESKWNAGFHLGDNTGFVGWHADGTVWAVGNGGRVVARRVGAVQALREFDLAAALQPAELVVGGVFRDDRHLALVTTHDRLLEVELATAQVTVVDAPPPAVGSPYGTTWLLARGDELLRSSVSERGVRIVSPTGTAAIPLPGIVSNSACLLPDGFTLAVATWPNVHYVDLSTRQAREVPMPDMIWSVAATPDGAVFAGGRDGGLCRIDGGGVRLVRRFDVGIPQLAARRDGRLLALGCNDGAVRITDPDGNLLLQLPPLDDIPWPVSFSPDGRLLLTASRTGQVRIWPLYLHESGDEILASSPYQEALRTARERRR